MTSMRKHLSKPNLLSIVKKTYSKIKDCSAQASSNISLTDCLMSGLAVFGLKFPSLLKFDEEKATGKIKRNLQSLFGVKEVPSDTHLRRRLDTVSPSEIAKPFKKIFAFLQRGKMLEPYQYMEKAYLLSVDGTGQYSSNRVHCDECCEKHHKNGDIEYYHQMLGAVIVHPEHKIVIPLAPEPITKQDGANKNDCERNASKRLLTNIRREHPHLKLIVVEDALASNGPHVSWLKGLNMHFILGVKPDGNKSLFEWVNTGGTAQCEETDEDGVIHRYRYMNNAPLNDEYFSLKVNFLEYWEIQPNGKKQHFSWITDFTITNENAKLIMKGGRARWRIENETFNTLKNQGYNFDHNYGHGNKHLCSVFTMLMMLTFLIDQVETLCCTFFKAAKIRMRANKYLWEKIRNYFELSFFSSWEDLYTAIAKRDDVEWVMVNTT